MFCHWPYSRYLKNNITCFLRISIYVAKYIFSSLMSEVITQIMANYCFSHLYSYLKSLRKFQTSSDIQQLEGNKARDGNTHSSANVRKHITTSSSWAASSAEELFCCCMNTIRTNVSQTIVQIFWYTSRKCKWLILTLTPLKIICQTMLLSNWVRR